MMSLLKMSSSLKLRAAACLLSMQILADVSLAQSFCTPPEAPEYGYLENESGVRLSDQDLQTLPVGTVLLVKCDDGDRPTWDYEIECQSRNGVPSFDEPGTCDQAICTKPQLQHAYLETESGIRLADRDLDDQPMGTVLVVKCDDGGDVTGRNKIECQSHDGVVTFETPGTCSAPPTVLPPNICTPPFVQGRGYLATESGLRLCDQALQALVVGTSLLAKCDDGGRAVGRNKITCNGRGDKHPYFEKPGTCRWPEGAPQTPPSDCIAVHPGTANPSAHVSAAVDNVDCEPGLFGIPADCSLSPISAGIQPTGDSIIITVALLSLMWLRRM